MAWDVVRFFLMVLATAAFALLRIVGFRSEAFQAFAHLWVGGLFGMWYGQRLAGVIPDRGFLVLALVLSAVELACFLVGKS